MTQMIVDFDVDVPMRDGTVLKADVYRPADSDTHPVLVQRTPYNRNAPQNVLIFDTIAAVRRGYIVVQQDTRGRFDSDGAWLPWAHEREDGYDTIVWASGLPRSSGKVGMFGGSYTGQTQWTTAIARPPGLVAIAPQLTWCDPADGLMFRGGAIELGLNTFWSLVQTASQLPKDIDDTAKLVETVSATVREIDELPNNGYWGLPSSAVPALERMGYPDIGVKRGLDNPTTTEECRVRGHHDKVTVPSLNTAGWYDVFLQGSLDNYVAMRELGVPTKLVVGAWTHGASTSWGQEGDVNFGMMSALAPTAKPTTDFQLDWFDSYLQDTPDTQTGAPVQIFVMGINEWRDEQEWPLARAVPTPLYLQGNGQLSFDEPTDEWSSTEFDYDPADPVTTTGGHLVLHPAFPSGPKNQEAVERRPDVLVFETTPFAHELEITGRITAILHAATDGPTTDWVVRLCEVDTDGISLNIADGITRVRTEPGRIDEVTIDLWSTSIVIKTGHRLRVHVTSSNFPRWDRNPNTDAAVDNASQMRIARQAVHHDRVHLSHLLLPLVPR